MIALLDHINALESQLAEALANEQSSAKAYAESLAREADLIGVIKTLSAALKVASCANDEVRVNGVLVQKTHATNCYRCVSLSSTREIRERIGAT